MFRVWGKVIKKNRLLKDYVAEIDNCSLTRTKKVYTALEMICTELDLASPIWLDINKKDFIRFKKTRFTKDSFIEDVDFDYLEFMVIEEDVF